MPGTMNWLVPVDSMTLTDQKNYRKRAVIALYRRAIEKKVGDAEDLAAVIRLMMQGDDAENPDSVDVRDFQPLLDAGVAAGSDWWGTAALAVVGTPVTCFQAVAAPILAANKVAVFYKVGIETIPVPVSRLTFRSGGALGNIQAVFDLEQLVNRQQLEGYFAEPVVLDPTSTFAIQATPRLATGVFARVTLGGLIAEPKGQLVA